MTIRKTLIEIQNSLSFEKLEPFKEGTIWTTFGEEERNLFAQLLLMQGEQQLAEGNAQVIESFKKAAEVSCQSPVILFRQGKILSQYKENIRCLNLAIQAFAKAIEQNPLFFEAWFERAQTLILIGLFEQDQTYLVEAKEHFEHVYSFMDLKKVDLSQFYNKWGECLYAIGKISGEPCDLQQALAKFHLADDNGCEEVGFFNEYGQCFAALAMLLRKPEYFEDAFHLFDRAVQFDSNHFESWFNRACCLQQMLEIQPSEFIEKEAEDSFARAAEINQELGLLWHKWGQLESFIGKIKRDYEKIESSFEKFEKANQLDPNQPTILCAWGLIQLFLGAHKEDISLIQSAQEKVIRALEIHPEDGQIWYIYGCCLNELGRYFADLRYLDQAIEKFEYALKLSHNNPILWNGMALSYFIMGELTFQKEHFEQAIKYFSKIVENDYKCSPQFWNDWGVTLLKLADITNQASYAEMAIDKFEKALKDFGQNYDHEGIDLEWVYNYGCALDLLGDCKSEVQYFEKAVHVLSQVVELDPEYIQARYNLAIALSHLGETIFEIEPFMKSLEHFHVLLELDPEDDLIHMDMGTLLINIGLLIDDIHHEDHHHSFYKQAEHHLIYAASLGNILSYYHLAGLYAIVQKYEQAMYYLERAKYSGSLPSKEELLADEWMEGLNHTDEFREFIRGLSK